MPDDDLDPFHQYFDDMTKRIEKIINGRMSAMTDQMVTLVLENESLRKRVVDLENLTTLQVTNETYLLRNLDLLIQELDAFEHYMAQKDPVLNSMLVNGKEKQAAEIKKRRLDVRQG